MISSVVIRTVAAVVGVAFCLTSTSALATPIVEYSFSGRLNTVSDTDGVLGGTFQVGDAFSGSLLFDLGVADSNASPVYGEYMMTTVPSGLSFSINGFGFSTNPSNLRMEVITRNQNVPDAIVDNFIVISRGGRNLLPSPFFLADNAIDFQLSDNTGTALSDDGLPVVLDLTRWTNQREIEVIAGDPIDRNRYYRLIGTIEELTQVPEPSTALLMLFGLALLISLMWVRRTS